MRIQSVIIFLTILFGNCHNHIEIKPENKSRRVNDSLNFLKFVLQFKELSTPPIFLDTGNVADLLNNHNMNKIDSMDLHYLNIPEAEQKTNDDFTFIFYKLSKIKYNDLQKYALLYLMTTNKNIPLDAQIDEIILIVYDSIGNKLSNIIIAGRDWQFPESKTYSCQILNYDRIVVNTTNKFYEQAEDKILITYKKDTIDIK